MTLDVYADLGSSPRGRGAQALGECFRDLRRIIPAGAGSTYLRRPQRWTTSDHPRGGGEHIRDHRSMTVSAGSSPRGRGAHRAISPSMPALRIIPAGAGSTSPCRGRTTCPGDHPRGGGEHMISLRMASRPSGSSPRGRGALQDSHFPRERGGIIPAGAGSTGTSRTPGNGRPDHPRGGGEHYAVVASTGCTHGSSPRGRGARSPHRRGHWRVGIIPAGAGSTTPS